MTHGYCQNSSACRVIMTGLSDREAAAPGLVMLTGGQSRSYWASHVPTGLDTDDQHRHGRRSWIDGEARDLDEILRRHGVGVAPGMTSTGAFPLRGIYDRAREDIVPIIRCAGRGASPTIFVPRLAHRRQ